MGITVVSSQAPASASASANAAATSASTPEGPSGGFAALLGSQLGLAMAGSLSASTAPAVPHDTAKTEEKPLGSEAADQTLALLMAVPAVTPPVQPSQQPRVDTSLTPAEAGKSQDETQQLAALTSEAPKTTTADLARQSTETFKNALNAVRDKQGETPTANIAAEANSESAAQASAAIAGAATSTDNKTRATAATTEVRTPLQSPSWGQDFSNKVVWMVKNDQHSAQININPPQLGPVQITLQINGDQATAIFASPHTEVRQAIESSLSQLRDMLATTGINLGQADIGANMARQNDNTPFQTANGNRGTDENAILPDIGRATDGTLSAPLQQGRGLVDLFA